MKIAELKIKTKINKRKMKKRKLETQELREDKHKMGNKFFSYIARNICNII